MASTGALDAVIDAAKTNYLEEQSRFQNIQQRAGVSLTFAGLLLGLLVVYVGERNYAEAAFGHIVYAVAVLAVIFLLIVIAIYCFLKAIMSGPYHQINTATFSKVEFMEEESESKVKEKIISSYSKAVNNNREAINNKSIICNRGLYILGIAFLIFIIYLILEEVIRYGG